MRSSPLGPPPCSPAPWGRFPRALCAVVIGGLVTGCTVGPDYHPPTRPMPSGWGETATVEPATRPTGAAATQSAATTQRSPIHQVPQTPQDLAQWWKRFGDPVLDGLIQESIKSNPNLQSARERIVQARAQRRITAAGLYPQLNAVGGYSRSRSGASTFNSLNKNGGTGGTGTTAGLGNTTGTGQARDAYQAGFDSSWEIDVFGGVRRAVEAADYNIQAAIEDRRDTQVILISEVARSYVDLRGFQREIEIAHENLQSQRTTLELTQAKLRAGAATELDVAQAESNVASTASTIPTLEIEAHQAMHALSVLLGEDPMSLQRLITNPRPIPPIPPEVPVALPAELLRQRPDIRRSERQLAAATAEIGAATAQLYPAFSLTGSLGLESSTFRALGNAASRFWSIGPSVSWPIFDAGKIRANIDVQNSLQRQALLTYETTVLTALQEVEDSLTAYEQEQARRQTLWQAVEANRRAADLSQQLYQAGRGDFLSVLDAERSLFAAEDQLVQSDRALSENLIAVYKALGGGWQDELNHPATQPAQPSIFQR